LPIGARPHWKLKAKQSILSTEESEDYPLEVDLNEFYHKAFSASPEERVGHAATFGVANQIIQSCKAMRKHWNKSNELKTQVAEISRIEAEDQRLVNILLNKSENSPQGKSGIVEWIIPGDQISNLEKITSTHRADNLQALQRITNSVYHDRRTELVNFNKDTRIFARELRQPVPYCQLPAMTLSSGYKKRLNEIDLHLEISRMKLCNPADFNFKNTDVGREISLLEQVIALS
jgi:hypothetical protein